LPLKPLKAPLALRDNGLRDVLSAANGEVVSQLASEAPAPYGDFYLIRNYDRVPIGFHRELPLPTSAVQMQLKCYEQDISVKHGFCCPAHRLDRGLVEQRSYLVPRSDGGAIKALESDIDE